MLVFDKYPQDLPEVGVVDSFKLGLILFFWKKCFNFKKLNWYRKLTCPISGRIIGRTGFGMGNS